MNGIVKTCVSVSIVKVPENGQKWVQIKVQGTIEDNAHNKEL